MKKIIIIMWAILMTSPCVAQERTILITESSLSYTNQEWFYSGANNALQEAKIKSCWNNGKRITSAAYTNNGWFVTMAQNTTIGAQTYKLSQEWPKEWIKSNWDQDYYITSISYGPKQWLVVMSKDANYTDQSWNRTDINSLAAWIKEKWDSGYYITNTCYNGTYWTAVMSKNSQYTSQGYLWAKNNDELLSKIKSKVWGQGYNVQTIEYGGGEYWVVYCKYKEHNDRAQNYQINPSDVSNYIQNKWNNSQDIAYIGGGGYQATTTYSSNNTNYTATPNNPTQQGDKYYYFDLGMSGNMHMWEHPDGSCTITQNMKCYSCQGSLKCNICFGTGNGYAYINRYMPCPACGATGRCATCKGTGFISYTKTWQPGEAEAYLKAHREVESQYRSQSSRQTTKSRDYIETIYYRPNYTGKPYPDEYCDKCQKWMQPHSHIKKSY